MDVIAKEDCVVGGVRHAKGEQFVYRPKEGKEFPPYLQKVPSPLAAKVRGTDTGKEEQKPA